LDSFIELVLVGHSHKSFVFKHTHKAKQKLKENKITWYDLMWLITFCLILLISCECA